MSIENYRGGLHLSRNGAKRLSRTAVTVRGVELQVEYNVIGAFLSATETDAAESPTVTVLYVEHANEDVTRLLSEDLLGEIATIIEDRDL